MSLIGNKAIRVPGPRDPPGEGPMGIVVTFPESRRDARDARAGRTQGASATIIILPVIRIERYNDEPSDGLAAGPNASGRKRRRRATRS